MDETTQTIELDASTIAPAAPADTSTGWSAQDESFFRIVDGLMTPSYLAGAGALLASYDED